jgi:hypothetical protein
VLVSSRIRTPAFSDIPFSLLRVYVSRTAEKAFRRCVLEYKCNLPRTSNFCLTASTLLVSDRLVFVVACERGTSSWRGVQAMPIWILVWSAVHTLFFFAAYWLQPFRLTAFFLFLRFCSCVCVCQEHLKRRSGDAYLNTCMIRRTRSIFVLPHTDSCLCWPTIFVLACECVKGRWRGL